MEGKAMRSLKYLSLSVIIFCGLSVEGRLEPEILADISPEAVESAKAYDGLKLLIGLGYNSVEHKAAITDFNKSSETKNNLNHMSGVLGLEYAKKIADNWLIGGTVLLDMWKTKKKRGSWTDLNNDYALARGNSYTGDKTAELQNAFISPEIDLKVGYILKSIKSTAFLKIGMQRVEGKYKYYANNREVASVNASAFVPLIGISLSRLINDKFGVAAEIDKSLNRQIKKYSDVVQHRVKTDCFTVRLMGTIALDQRL